MNIITVYLLNNIHLQKKCVLFYKYQYVFINYKFVRIIFTKSIVPTVIYITMFVIHYLCIFLNTILDLKYVDIYITIISIIYHRYIVKFYPKNEILSQQLYYFRGFQIHINTAITSYIEQRFLILLVFEVR